MSPRIRFIVAAATAALLLGACGEGGLLDGLGARSQEAVIEESSTTTTVVVETQDGDERAVVAAADVEWYNDTIERQFQGVASQVIEQVWQRRDGENRFIQASRLEIASALPDIRFPAFLPESVGWITSQLVYDIFAAQLDRDTSAAFGLWAVEPYTVTEGRVAVLRVGLSTEDQRAAGFDIIADPVEEGLSLSWVTGAYRYELFCRVSLSEDLCWQMAETNKLLSSQLRGAGSSDTADA
jgi:hypothetical protein